MLGSWFSRSDGSTGVHLLSDEVLAVFFEEYAAETVRLKASTTDSQPQRDLELAEIDQQNAFAKTAIIKGVAFSMCVPEMKAWAERRDTLLAEADRVIYATPPAIPLLSPCYLVRILATHSTRYSGN